MCGLSPRPSLNLDFHAPPPPPQSLLAVVKSGLTKRRKGRKRALSTIDEESTKTFVPSPPIRTVAEVWAANTDKDYDEFVLKNLGLAEKYAKNARREQKAQRAQEGAMVKVKVIRWDIPKRD
jgi:hypothetical protein